MHLYIEREVFVYPNPILAYMELNIKTIPFLINQSV